MITIEIKSGRNQKDRRLAGNESYPLTIRAQRELDSSTYSNKWWQICYTQNYEASLHQSGKKTNGRGKEGIGSDMREKATKHMEGKVRKG